MAKLYKQDVSEVKKDIDVEEMRTVRSLFAARANKLLTVTDPASSFYISTNEKSRLSRKVSALYQSLPLSDMSLSHAQGPLGKNARPPRTASARRSTARKRCPSTGKL
ncbi:MAG: hypothetical protein LKF10_08980 [Eubacterium sp.]|jgi:hypothetical protein|nr:hypothetical protein [Eubacterium sp.]